MERFISVPALVLSITCLLGFGFQCAHGETELPVDDADSATIYVSAANTEDPLADGTLAHPFPSIQQGIDASTASVLVAEGTYTEGITITEKGLIILGGYDPGFAERDPALHVTVIDTAGEGSAVTYENCPPGALDGFTITGSAKPHHFGNGIYCIDSSPVISNNIITDNAAMWREGFGGGIFCGGNSSPVIIDNVIAGNTTTHYLGSGGGIYCDSGSSPTIIGNMIADNTTTGLYSNGGGISCGWASSPTIIKNIITRNTTSGEGGGIYCDRESWAAIAGNTIAGNMAFSGGAIYCGLQSFVIITNNTITGNMASGYGYGDGIVRQGSPSASGTTLTDVNPVTITNCILWGNGDELYNCSATYSCVQDGDEGEGNISSYPHFVDPYNDDHSLLSWSPCIDAGDPGFVPQPDETDIAGNPRVIGGRVDMGAYESETNSPDTDSDGLPDDWEIEHFGDISAPADGDPEGDGLANREEYDLGTNPRSDTRTIHVSAANAGDPLADGSMEHPYATIQRGVDESIDTVLVAEGDYIEQITIDGKTLHIAGGYNAAFTGRDPALHVTVIDAGGGGSAVRYIMCPAGSLGGFTITGGAAQRGAGIRCFKSSPVIAGNIITGNTASRSGGGVYYGVESSPAIINNTIAGNTASLYGGGVYCGGEFSLAITNNLITGNLALDRGGAIYCSRSSPTITNNTITVNKAAKEGGGIYCDGGSSPTITNCIFWENIDDLSGCSATYSCIQDGDEGEGNISLLPHFADPYNGDYQLLSWSPCIDAGNPDFAPQPDEIDIAGNPRVIGGRVDMGAWEAPARSLDTDSDGLPDDWEAAHLGGTSATPEGDPDGDGLTNQEEYEAGTYPGLDSRTIYVSAANAGDPLADGTIGHPFASIRQGVGTSSESVLVAEGIYIERLIIAGKTLHLIGGYDSTFAKRDPLTYLTVVAPPTGGSVVRYVDCPAGTLDGFAITGGDTLLGGGVRCDRSSPTITNSIIAGNRARTGGAIYCSYESAPTITNNIIAVNTAGRDGGGIYCYGRSSTITGNMIAVNFAFWDGGGIYCADSSPTIANNTIGGNAALWEGGGIYCDDSSPTISSNNIIFNAAAEGGGIHCDYDSSPAISSNNIASNAAEEGGGAIYCDASSPTITGNTIAKNDAGEGGGIFCDRNSSPAITGNTIKANVAEESGGGIHCDDSSPTIANNTIAGNTAEGSGGAIYCQASSPAITSNTITFNSAVEGGGIYSDNSSLKISNCILWENTASTGADLYLDGWRSHRSKTLTVRYTNISGGATGAYVAEGWTLDMDSTNIDLDPLFADPGRWDDSGTPDDTSDDVWIDGDYHLKSKRGRWYPAAGGWVLDDVTSPCIDAGDPASDFANEPEPGGTRINMGAYGNTARASKGLPHTLTVLSTPIAGVEIGGDKPGTTNYAAGCDDQEIFTLTAPLTTSTSEGVRYSFVGWDTYPEGQNTIEVTTDGNRTLSVVYEIQTHTLSIGSKPNIDVVIAGDRPGTTYYTATCNDQDIVGLTAPAAITIGSARYDFLRWIVNGVDQPDGQTLLRVTVDADMTATAVYDAPDRFLTVLSIPIDGVGIAGDKPGATPRTATCDDQQIVTLAAPATIPGAGGKGHNFHYWIVDGEPQAYGQAQLQLKMGSDHTAIAVYDWRLDGDSNGDDEVNLLDVLYVQERMDARCED